MFIEDTTGFLPGREQEMGGIVQAGRAMLDAIIDLRTPRFLVILRNAFGGAYASYNNYPTGADFVIALPTTRAAVMGPAGVEFVYKDELRAIRAQREDFFVFQDRSSQHQDRLPRPKRLPGEDPAPESARSDFDRRGTHAPLHAVFSHNAAPT